MTRPAFILGNGPTLPISQLNKLRGQLTIGINRIVRSGFVPVAIMHVDAIEPEWLYGHGAIVIRGANLGAIAHPDVRMIGICSGDAYWKPGTVDRRILHANGCTGAAAAKWAAMNGCEPVYMLGCGGAGGHFYDPGTEAMGETFRTEYAQLVKHFPCVRFADDITDNMLAEPLDQAALRQWVIDAIPS